MDMQGTAKFCSKRKYRYLLTRSWNRDLPVVCFVMLNPSQADQNHNDNTIRRCIGFAQSWGYGGLEVVNLFAFMTPYPDVLLQANDPVGKDNERHLRAAIKRNNDVVLAWGNLGKLKDRLNYDLGFLNEAYCLKVNKTGDPCHPLYLPKTLKPKKFKLAA